MDGANVEIHDAVGEENIFIFGMKVNEVKKLRAEGYNPEEFLEQAPKLKRALDLISMGYFSQENPGIFDPVMDNMKRDFYMIAADFNSYYDTQQEVASEFQNKDGWDKKAIINVANMGHFSSDRSIQEYANNIWSLKPISVP
jgi:starch phosphorylase